jgi:dTDP-4-dehydrorhamnose reductase
MRILVTGAAGMLGSGVVPTLVRAGHEVLPTDMAGVAPGWDDQSAPRAVALDVRAAQQVNLGVEAFRPDLVMHLAAITGLEDCERDPDNAFATNAVGTKHVALACARARIPMVYISTAGVFDGTKDDAYVEFDTPNPINVYGHSKYEGERYVQWFLDRCYIVRAGWMVGGGAKDHKFVAKMLAQIKAGATRLNVVGDKLGTPTYVPDFARTLLPLVESESYGLYHMVCGGSGSRLSVCARILEVLGRDDIELVEVDSSFFAEEFFAERPRSEIMRNMILDLQGMNTMRGWEEAIEDYLAHDLAALGHGVVQRVVDLTDRDFAAA